MKHFTRLSAAVLCLVLAASTFGASAAPEKAKLKMAMAGTSTQIYFLAVNVAKAHGYFKDEGLDVETMDLAGGAKALEAVVGGSADIDAGSFELEAVSRGIVGKRVSHVVHGAWSRRRGHGSDPGPAHARG